MTISVSICSPADAAELAEVAAATFPLACPPGTAGEDIAEHIAEHLSAQRFAEFLADPQRHLLAARAGDRMVGYAMLIGGGDGVELSKIYVHADQHGRGAAAALMAAAITWAQDRGAGSVWLGVNQGNRRAQRFYRKHGFEITGTRTFRLGSGVENDYVMTRILAPPRQAC